jgi:hypothetical protein
MLPVVPVNAVIPEYYFANNGASFYHSSEKPFFGATDPQTSEGTMPQLLGL